MKEKNFGIKNLILVILVILVVAFGFLSYSEYSYYIESLQVKKIVAEIDKIVIDNIEISSNDLENCLEFDKSHYLCKGSTNATIYYKNGTIEQLTALIPCPTFYRITLNGKTYNIYIERIK